MGFKTGKSFAVAGLDAFGHQDLLKGVAEDRRRYLGPVERAPGRIQHDQHGVLGFVRRHEADKGRDIFSGRVTALFGDLLGGTRLTCDPVALDPGGLAAAFADHLFHHAAHLGCHFRRDDVPHHLFFAFADHFPVRRYDAVDDIGF